MATEADIPQIIHTTNKEGEGGSLSSETLKLELNEIEQDETRKVEHTHKEIINTGESEDVQVETNINVDTTNGIVKTAEDQFFIEASSVPQGVFHDSQTQFDHEENSTKIAEESIENSEEISKTANQIDKGKNLSQSDQIECEEDGNPVESENPGGEKQDQDSITEPKKTEDPEIDSAIEWIKESNQLEENKIVDKVVEENVVESSNNNEKIEEVPKEEKLKELKAAEPNAEAQTQSIEELFNVKLSSITTTDKNSEENVNEKDTEVTELKEEEKNLRVENIEIHENLVEKSSSAPHVYEEETREEIIHKIENPGSKMQPENYDLVSDTYESRGVNFVADPVEATEFAENENIQIPAADLVEEKEEHKAESQSQDHSDGVTTEENIVQVHEKFTDPEIHADESSKDVEMVSPDEELPESTKVGESSHAGELQTLRNEKSGNSYLDAVDSFEGEIPAKETFVEDPNPSIVTKEAILTQEDFKVSSDENVEIEKPDVKVIEEIVALETKSTNETAEEATLTTREDQDTIKRVIEESESDKECIPQSIEPKTEQEGSQEVQETVDSDSYNEEITIINLPSSASVEKTIQESFQGEERDVLESTKEIVNSDREFTSEDIKDGTDSDATSVAISNETNEDVTHKSAVLYEEQKEEENLQKADDIITEEKEVPEGDKPQEYTSVETQEEQLQNRDESTYLASADIEKGSENDIVIPEGEKLLKPEFEEKIEDQSPAVNVSTDACETSADIYDDILDQDHTASDFKSSLAEDLNTEKEVDELVVGGHIREIETSESEITSTVKDEEIDDNKSASENTEIEETAQTSLSSPSIAEESLGEEEESIAASKDEVTNTDRELDLVENTSVPSVFEKETEEEIVHESEKITTGVTETTTPEELDSVDIKHGQVSEFDESTNVELLTPKISDETDIPAAKILRDFVLEQNPEEPHATSSSEHAVLTTKEVHDDEQHIPAGQTEEGVSESENREAGDVVEFSHTEQTENFDEEKLLNAEVEKDTPEDTLNETSNKSYQTSVETEQASQEQEHSATNIETSIKEDAELYKESVELKAEETIQEVEVSENQDSVETQEQPNSDFEQVTEEKTNEGVPLSDDIDDTATIPRDFNLGENKYTEILAEAKEGADESEEKPGDDMQQETYDTSPNVEDATAERSSVHTTEQNLEDSSAVLTEEHNHVTAEVSDTVDESQKKVEMSPVSTYAPSSADIIEDNLLQEQIEPQSPRDGTYLASLDTKENSINDEFDEEAKKPVVDAPNEAVDTSLEIESVTVEQVKDPELTENPEVTTYNEEKTMSEAAEYENNKSYSETDASKVTPADETSEHLVEKETGEEILHEPDTVTTGVTEEAVPAESDYADVKDANVLESDENKNVEILTPEISDERAVPKGEIPRDFELEQDPKESYATLSSEDVVLTTEEVNDEDQPIPARHTEECVTESGNVELLKISEAGNVAKQVENFDYEKLNAEEKENSEDPVNKTQNEACHTSVEIEQASEEQENSATNVETRIKEYEELHKEAETIEEVEVSESNYTSTVTEEKAVSVETQEQPSSNFEPVIEEKSDEVVPLSDDIEVPATIPREFDLGENKNTEILTEAKEGADLSEEKPENDMKEETDKTSSIIEDEGEVVTAERSSVYTTEKNLEDSSNDLSEAHNQVTTDASETANEIEVVSVEQVKDSELKENPEVTTYTDTEETKKHEAAETGTPKLTPADEISEDLVEDNSVPYVLDKEIGEKILYESETITTGVPEAETLEEFDRSEIKYAQVSDFDESKNVEILTPEISDERDVSTGETPRDIVLEQDPKESYATSVSDDAVLTTEEVLDGEQQVPAQHTEEGIHESRDLESLTISEAGEVAEVSNTEQVEKFDDEKLLDVEAEKNKPEDPVNKTFDEAGSGETEQARQEQEHSATDVETTIKEDAELFTDAVELKETTQEAEISETDCTSTVADENKEYVETLDQSRSEFEPVVEEKINEAVSLSDDIDASSTIVLDENKSTEILTEAKEEANESEEKPDDVKEEETCDTPSIIEDEREVVTADRSIDYTTEQNLEDSSTDLLEQQNHATTEASETADGPPEKVETYPVSTYVPPAADTIEDKLPQKEIEPISPSDGAYLASPDTEDIETVTVEQVKDSELKENPEETKCEAAETDTLKVTPAAETSEDLVENTLPSVIEKEIGEEILHEPETITTEVPEAATLEELERSDIKHAQDLEFDESKNVEILTPEISGERDVSTGETPRDIVLEQDPKEPYATSVSDDAVLTTEEVHDGEQQVPDQQKEESIHESGRVESLIIPEAGEVAEFSHTEQVEKLLDVEAEKDIPEDPVNKTFNEAGSEETEQARQEQEHSATDVETSIKEDAELFTEAVEVKTGETTKEVEVAETDCTSTVADENKEYVETLEQPRSEVEPVVEEKSSEVVSLSDDIDIASTVVLNENKNTMILTEAKEEAIESEEKPDDVKKEETCDMSSIIEDDREFVTADRSFVYTTEQNLEDSSTDLLEEHNHVTTEASGTADEPQEKVETPRVSTYAPQEKEEVSKEVEEAKESVEEEVGNKMESPDQTPIGNLENTDSTKSPETRDLQESEDQSGEPEFESRELEGSDLKLESTEDRVDDSPHEAEKEESAYVGESTSVVQQKNVSEIKVVDFPSEDDKSLDIAKTTDSNSKEILEKDTLSEALDLPGNSTVVKEISAVEVDDSCQVPSTPDLQTNERALESVFGEEAEKSKERETTEQQNVAEITEPEAEEHQSGIANESITNEIIEKEIAKDSAVESPHLETVGKDVQLAEEYSKVKNIQELDSTTNAIQNEELPEVIQIASLDENKQEVLANKKSIEEEETSDATEAPNTGAIALSEEVKHEEGNESTIYKEALNIPNVVEDAQAEEAAPKVLQEVEEICEDVPKEPAQEKLQANYVNTDIEEKNVDISESLKDGEKPDNTARELTFDSRDITDDLNLKEQSISPNEEPSNIISEKQIATREIIPEEIKFNKNETELAGDKEKVEKFDEPKIHSTVSAYSDTKTQDQSNVSSHVNDSSVETTKSNKVDFVSDKDLLVKSYPEVQPVPEKQIIQESEDIKSANASAIEPTKTQTEETREVDRSLLIEQREAKETTTPVEEENEDEHERMDSGSDGPVMVEASTDVMEKAVPCKKSHNILSGVGSKVKHSIAKVRKVITGKSSHPKPSSPK
jgi:hypothetical protein